jgi:DNA-binding CsgD family transcriptional regulator
VYGLTNAEARLLRFLSDGCGLLEAARELVITKNTARTHMRSIYAKVGTHRQSDLVRLLHRFTLF